MVETDPLNGISHNAAVYMNVTTTLKEGLQYYFIKYKIIEAYVVARCYGPHIF
jgi:hypothetical protein